MKTLYINTCTKKIIIKVFNKNKVIKEESITGQTNNSQFIMPTIKKALEDNLPDEIIVANGPGSFTGVRLGVTIAKTMAYIKDIPIKTITTLEEMAVSLNLEQKIVALEENNGYFVAIFNKNNELIGDYQYLTKLEFENFSQKYDVKTNVTIDDYRLITYCKEKESINPHKVNPIYVKLIDVEKK